MSLNIGGDPVRKIYWGADEIQEVRQGQNLVFVPSVVVHTRKLTHKTGEEASQSSGSLALYGLSTSPGPIDVTTYKRLRVRATLTPDPDYFNSSAATLSVTLSLRSSDGVVSEGIELGSVTCTADKAEVLEYLLTFPGDFDPGDSGLINLYSMNYKFRGSDWTGETRATAAYEFEAIS